MRYEIEDVTIAFAGKLKLTELCKLICRFQPLWTAVIYQGESMQLEVESGN